MAKKPIATPEDQLHIVAAILAAGLAGQNQVAADKPNSLYNLTMQRYRQFVRLLSRSGEREQGADEEE